MNDDFLDPPSDNGQAATAQHHGRVDLGNVDDALTSGAPAAKFAKIGDTIKGEIVSCEMAQQRDLATGKLSFWDDGNPKVQILIVLATELRDPDIDDDNGHRTLYVKKPGAMLKAIGTALGKTKLSQAIGGTLAVKYSADGQPSQRGFNAPKQYVAKFWDANGAAAEVTPPANTNTPSYGPKEAMRDAWAKFQRQSPGEDAQVVGGAWKSAIVTYFPGKTKEQISVHEWNRFAADNFKPLPSPISDSDPLLDEPPF